MNKAELIDVLTDRLNVDRRSAAEAVEEVVSAIVRAVHRGESVTITGFGVFERRRRAARVARNPRTGETVKVKPTQVPAFRPGAQFKAIVSGAQRIPAEGPAVKRGVGTAGTRRAAKKAPARKATRPATKRAATTAPARKAAAKKAPAKKTAAKRTPAKTTATKATKAPAKKAVKKTTAKAPARKAPARKAPAKKAAARKAPATKAPARKATARKGRK